MDLLYNLDEYVLAVIGLLGVPVGLYAFVHALRQRADAFTAVGKLTKGAWLGITGASLFFLVVFPAFAALRFPGFQSLILAFQGPRGTTGLFWLAALIAVLIYLLDVKPKVHDVQQGPRW